MGRLTKKDSDGEVYTDEYIEEILLIDAETGDCTSIYTGSVIDRLYEYEEAAEQALEKIGE
ncbi:MAG: hypothetical protein IJA10_11545 [Lachnospiraceae bacterium]|nr:hypothetical protein [Lachnospiraceae bacterium]